MERTNVWGGQHELIALSKALKRNIVVLRHDMTKQQFPVCAVSRGFRFSP
jgi:hypothetical protein